jgi:hypothetical protein
MDPDLLLKNIASTVKVGAKVRPVQKSPHVPVDGGPR